MVRVSSPVGWLPLLLGKIIFDRSFKAFLIAGFTITIPIILISIGLDTWYYGQFTISSWAFLKFNVLENKSSVFGVSPPEEYLKLFVPDAMKFGFAFSIGGLALYSFNCLKKKEPPYVTLFVITFLAVLSYIPHKEQRFALPVFPYLYLMCGLSMQWFLKRFGKIVIALVIFNAIYETSIFLFYNTQCGISFLPIKYIAEHDSSPHSVY